MIWSVTLRFFLQAAFFDFTFPWKSVPSPWTIVTLVLNAFDALPAAKPDETTARAKAMARNSATRRLVISNPPSEVEADGQRSRSDAPFPFAHRYGARASRLTSAGIGG